MHDDIVRLGRENCMGPIFLDDLAFVPLGDTVKHVGQVLGIIVGVSQEIAERGACAVAVQYEDLEGNAVVRFKDAIKTNSFWAEVIHEMRPGRASV
jgi:xanthine dehydrogenase/oxidase